MLKWFAPLLFIAASLYTFSQKGKKANTIELAAAFTTVEKKFASGNRIADNAGNDSSQIVFSENLYQEALSAYSSLIPELIEQNLDSLAIIATTHAGIINHYFDSLPLALNYYKNAIELKASHTILPDSLIFQPLLFASSILYGEGAYDTALFYLRKAETIKNKYAKTLTEEPRLYNLLGVMYYETGNLKQAINYLEKAISLLQQTPQPDKTLLTNYRLNIASSLIKLEKYSEAKLILIELLKEDLYLEEVNQKLGYIALKEKKYPEAIIHFNKASYASGKKAIELYINKSLAYNGLKITDSVNYYLSAAKTENIKWNALNQSVLKGLILKTEGDIEKERGHFLQAAKAYHAAIINFSNTFQDTALTINPANFTGVFSYIDMFYSLISKAEMLEKLFNETNDLATLKAALEAYQAAFQLSSYIEATYNSDEARLFLNKIKYFNHNKPIHTSIRLFELTKGKRYLEQAYFFDQANKASILSLSLSESEVKTDSKNTNDLIDQIGNIKTNITRNTLKISTLTDSVDIKKLHGEIREKEIELNNLQETLKNEPAWKLAYSNEAIPSINNLQKKLDSKSAIISYHLSETDIISLIITRNKLDYSKTKIDSSFYNTVAILKKDLQKVTGGYRYIGNIPAKQLYKILMTPIRSHLTQIERLVIIPDDELHYLPFEALQDENNFYLLQKFSVQYLFSTSLINSKEPHNTATGFLSFAPFADKSYIDSTGEKLNQLPASSVEINAINGQNYFNEKATKQAFLKEANHYSTLHLATHASVDNINPDKSFIAFSPINADFKLYAKEIYNLRLDSTDLVILSACETGAGQLVKGEGLMSLSRAFAYAGCKNIITSLWKAEDIATAYISTQLHLYLSKGFTKDRALQNAKLDFLKNEDINPQLKTPNFWAHLIFIGNYEPASSSSNWPWIALVIISFGIFYLVLNRLKKRID